MHICTRCHCKWEFKPSVDIKRVSSIMNSKYVEANRRGQGRSRKKRETSARDKHVKKKKYRKIESLVQPPVWKG